MERDDYKKHLKKKMDAYVHHAYRITKKFPREELYGVVSQLRRAALSVILNYVEGYARKKSGIQLQFLDIAYGSLQESKYLLNFSLDEGYLTHEEFSPIHAIANEIGAMLWTESEAMRKSIQEKK